MNHLTYVRIMQITHVKSACMQCARMIVRAHVVIRMPLVVASLEVKVVRQKLYRM